MEKLLLGTFLVSTITMTGLIWFVQIVHYPLFQQVGEKNYEHYQNRHMALTTYVVAPLMLLEVLCTAYFTFINPYSFSAVFLWGNAILLGLIWASTTFLQVPIHQKLIEKYVTQLARKLVSTNWIRTWSWTTRSLWLTVELLNMIN